MRDPWLDNIKFVLVTFVVIGHALPLVPTGTDFGAQLYDFIYYWHIPAFVLVTGYLSRSFVWSRRHLTALATGLLLPYLVFESVMRQVIAQWGAYTPADPYLINPGWPMWYLVATILWRLATPVLRAHWLMLPGAVALSLWIGTVNAEWTEWFDLSRTIGFLPFFTLGLWLSPERLERLRGRGAAVLGAVVLLGIWQLAGNTDDWMSTRWLWYAFSYSDLRAAGLPVDDLDGAWIRLRLLFAGAAASLAVMALVPRGRHWFTPLGAASLVVYLFHGFVIRAVGTTDFTPWATQQGVWVVWAAIAAAIALSATLAAPPVANRLSWLVDPVSQVRRLRRTPVSR